jgi:cation/acetate symporter
LLSSLTWILLSGETYKKVYHIDPATALMPFKVLSQPGLITIPLGFIVLIVVSLLTQPKTEQQKATV